MQCLGAIGKGYRSKTPQGQTSLACLATTAAARSKYKRVCHQSTQQQLLQAELLAIIAARTSSLQRKREPPADLTPTRLHRMHAVMPLTGCKP